MRRVLQGFNLKLNRKFTSEQSEFGGQYTIKSKMSGSSDQDLYDSHRNFVNMSIKTIDIDGVTIIRDKKSARQAVKILKMFSNRIHAWDTETVDLNVKQESVVGNGKVICASAFCGMDVDFGNGPRLFIDNFAQNSDLIMEFKDYLENEKYQKVWHNYGFDRHVFYNHGIDVQGLGGDTMHMARLLNASLGPKSYSLEKLTGYYEQDIIKMKKDLLDLFEREFSEKNILFEEIKEWVRNKQGGDLEKIFVALGQEQFYKKHKQNEKSLVKLLELQDEVWRLRESGVRKFKENFLKTNLKLNMRQIFAKKKILKSGKEGHTFEFPTIIRMHCDPEHIKNWIFYSTLDAEITFFLYNVLKQKLAQLQIQGPQSMPYTKFFQKDLKNNFDLYQKYWRPFGTLLTDMERRGFKIDKEHLQKSKKQAEQDIKAKENKFLEWVATTQSPENKNIKYFNPSSVQQLQQLFFAPYQKNSHKKATSSNKIQDPFIQNEIENLTQIAEEQTRNYDDDDMYYSDGRKKGDRKEVTELTLEKAFKIENVEFQEVEGKKKAPKKIDLIIKGLGWPVEELTVSGMPSVETPTLKKLCGNPKKKQYGDLYQFYKSQGLDDWENKAIKACEALNDLVELKSLETLLQTFIGPLIGLTDKQGRIHCSININTETGRLSARKPNLLNQPALDKDIYKIREAFICEKKNKLIVADYGQLELRILAHMTQCATMIKAFEQGGDFHSRTAASMYPEIKSEIEKGTLLIEWDKSKGENKIPLLKDKYASERKKAKTMNFSIAYGKSAYGFAKDWDCSLEEAQKALDLWYSERQEVKKWQEKIQNIAKENKYTQTLMGRYRFLDKYFDRTSQKSYYSHGMRAAINTPIQGGAADLVIAAMIKVDQDPFLKKNNWNIILQIHDELILEGPEETANEALKRVKYLMENPFDQPLSLAMEVDAKLGNNWYECK